MTVRPSFVFLFTVLLAAGCAGGPDKPDQTSLAAEARLCDGPEDPLREVIYRDEGVQGRLDVPNCWETNQARGVLVANPLPPNDRAFVMVVTGGSAEEALERAHHVAGVEGAEYASAASSGQQSAAPANGLEQGKGRSSVTGESTLAYVSHTVGGRWVVVFAIYDESFAEPVREMYQLALQDVLTGAEFSEARTGNLQIGHARPADESERSQ